MSTEKFNGFPIRYDIAVYRGDTWERMFRFIARDGTTGDAYLLDTTDFSASFQVRETVDSVGVLTAAVTRVGVQGTAPNQYNLSVSIPSDVTENYPHGATWRYDLELTDPSGRPKTMMYGEFYVQGDVSR